MTNTTEKINIAKEYFRKAHDSIGQTRKYDGCSYWTHTERVAQKIWDILRDEDLTIASLGHDAFEDITPLNPLYSIDNVRKQFGDKITDYILEVTNVYIKEKYPLLNRKQRHELEHKRLATVSNGAKSIKLADIIDNVDGLVDVDPGFGKVYVAEKVLLLPLLREGNLTLFQEANSVLAKEIYKLNLLRK